MQFAIETEGLRKTYKGAWSPSLDGLSLNVQKGKITGLLGPNGAGKTTTINILSGLVKPDSGTAKVFGKDCVKEMRATRSLLAVVPQQIALFGELTAWQNFRYIGRMYGIEERVITERATLLLQKLGLEKHAGKRIDKYSGGMKRRANIIASLLHEPGLLILDEPTAGVDVQSRALIVEFLKEYNRRGNTLLYTSHLMEEAEKICDEVFIIDEGKNITGGAPRQLIAETKDCRNLEDVFLFYTGHSVRD